MGDTVKLIIEIPKAPKNDHERWALTHGIPLPKGHGRLIDIKQVAELLVFGDYLKDNVKCGDITRILDMATIIEADKESEE